MQIAVTRPGPTELPSAVLKSPARGHEAAVTAPLVFFRALANPNLTVVKRAGREVKKSISGLSIICGTSDRHLSRGAATNEALSTYLRRLSTRSLRT